MYTFLCSKLGQVGKNKLQSLVHLNSFAVVYDRDDQLGYSQFPVIRDELPGFSDAGVKVRCLVITINVFTVVRTLLCCLLVKYQELQLTAQNSNKFHY